MKLKIFNCLLFTFYTIILNAHTNFSKYFFLVNQSFNKSLIFVFFFLLFLYCLFFHLFRPLHNSHRSEIFLQKGKHHRRTVSMKTNEEKWREKFYIFFLFFSLLLKKNGIVNVQTHTICFRIYTEHRTKFYFAAVYSTMNCFTAACCI